jgi:Protein of unknown function (DUF1553)/Protein of unknown function (DUF1549)/Concanavalin A-like lectin/glucanases superfamily/Planctomycete cytochrome C
MGLSAQQWSRSFGGLLLAAGLLWGEPGLAGAQNREVEFNQDIRPILSDHCYTCHGPDKANRKTELRFDTQEGAFADLGGYRAIVPGDLAKSEMIRRVTAADEAIRMPPVYSGRSLTAHQIDLLSRWVEQGAEWQKHWSFIPPKPPELPTVKNRSWPHNAIDSFVLERLEREGLKPSGEAEPTTLIRRVTLDLTGLPPTPAEVDAFLADKSPHAYEKLVDRLLQSPRYGERMATRWLDAARYADTNGYQTDAERVMWRWRDWVIGAFNRNLPFDQFTIEQLAGDLLPNAGLDQKLATGFNRNHRGNGEGGIIPEEYAVEYVVDRVETTATVWLGLTMGCARCHDHKYDPITQKEFYQVFAFFNNVPERGKAFKYGNSPPFLFTPTPDQQKELDTLERKLAKAESYFKTLKPQVTAAQMAWEKALNKTQPLHWGPSAGLAAHFPLDGSTAEKVGEAAGSKPLDARFVDGEAEFAMGQTGLAASFNGKRFIEAGEVGNFGFYDRFSLGAWIHPTSEKGGTILSRTKETPEEDGYSLRLENGKVQLNLVVRWLDDALRVETEQPLPLNRWHHVLVTYDASRLASGVRIYVNSKPQALKVLLDELNQNFKSREPFRIGAGGGPTSRFQGDIDDVRVYPRVLSADEVKIAANSDSITAIAAIPPDQRSAVQAAKIEAYFLEKHAPQPIQQARQRLLELQEEKQHLLDRVPTTMIMEEMKSPRETFVLQRGAYDRPGEKVTAAGVPACLPPLPSQVPRTRLSFARWLVDPANPLTARVAVNSYWQMLFGTGLVKTVEDFGSQGEWPTHPELLDWLATEFIRSGWDIKGTLKTIVTSATYRQSSKVSPELAQKDPDNRLLARGPRVRLSAEMVRDQALAISGLLVEKLGGPSVKPYQPAGVWKDLSGGEDYQPDSGEGLYRRSLYTFWKRTAAPPVMINFDSASRETCVVRETRTNTPLQALNLMNDVTFVEASRVLAQRVMSEAGPTPEERLALAFRLATARPPKPAERDILLAGLEHHLANYGKDPKAAVKLVSTGEFPVNEKLDVCELAAYTTMASMILNFDEVITKE